MFKQYMHIHWPFWRPAPRPDLNLLELSLPAAELRRQRIYWASIIATIVLHGSFLGYVLFNSRSPSAPPARLALADGGPGDAPALPRGDREDVAALGSPARAGKAKRYLAYAVEIDDVDDKIDQPLPEDVTTAERSPIVQAPAPARSRNPRAMAPDLPARRNRLGAKMSLLPREDKLSSLTDGDPDAPRAAPADNPASLAGAKSFPRGAPAKAAVAEDRQAAALADHGERRPVAALLPKQAGSPLYRPGQIEAGPLPEDRYIPGASSSPAEAGPANVPPPVKRMAAIGIIGEAGSDGEPRSVRGRDSGEPSATPAQTQLYRSRIRRHLAAHRPSGGYGAGRAVVSFTLSSSGQVLSARIVDASGSPALNESVLDSVYRSEPFPRAPAGLESAQLRFVIPFRFE